ncbi:MULTISPECIES: HIT family protein [unclassified Campylobacter]|uniref:HIT family protein n=1 Tax=unclassified Campylobacter TaxID=2593542 RepID=UPI003D336D52
MIFEDEFIWIEREENELPWVKIFTKKPFRELSDCDEKSLARLWEASLIVEREMRKFYNPTKINLASFANVLPRVHMHIMARFKDDAFYPNNLWQEPLRNSSLSLPEFSEFAKILQKALSEK